MSVDDRIQFIQHPIALPGICAICGFPGGTNTDGREFVDWGLSLEFYGAVIFCTSCFKSAAEKLGFLSYEDTQLLRRQVSETVEEISMVKAENDHLRVALSKLNLVPQFASRNPDIESEPEIADEGIGSDSQDESGPDKPSNGGGYTGVQSDDGDNGPGLQFIKF
jgi:hypothetical protein